MREQTVGTLHHAVARFETGLHRVGEGIWIWLQPNGDFGEANSVLVSSPSADGASLLIDTLFDQRQARRLLQQVYQQPHLAPLRYAVNTHNDPDHWWGNAELDLNVEIIASTTAIQEMRADPPPWLMAALRWGARAAGFFPGHAGCIAARLAESFAPFQFGSVRRRYPTTKFDGFLEMDLGDRVVHLHEFRAAHTASDTIVHIPDAGVVVCGDLLWTGVVPIVWHGPIGNWIAALDAVLALAADRYLPGHGDIATADDVRRLREYLVWVNDCGAQIHRTHPHVDLVQAAREMLASLTTEPWKNWTAPERLVVSLATRICELRGQEPISQNSKGKQLWRMHQLADILARERAGHAFPSRLTARDPDSRLGW